jgi:hypothetical protein
MKGLIPHFAALFVASVLAFAIWSHGDKPLEADAEQKIEVWSGTPDHVERIQFDSPKRTVTLDARNDSTGRYYVATLDKEETAKPPLPPAADAGVDAAATQPAKHVTTRFIGVKEADELASKLAPLLAVRELGPFAPSRAEEFGLDKPEGTLKVKIGGTEHALLIGSSTPGGSERYAKDEKSGLVYAVSGDPVQSMLGAESRLLERDLHGFADGDQKRLRLSRSGKTREVVSMPDKKGGWADAATPSKLDETIGNYLAKVSRLRVMDYVENTPSPLTPESAILRIDYFGDKKTLGFLELYKLPGEKGSDYYVRTENSRWFVKVLATAGEQVEQDAASVVK